MHYTFPEITHLDQVLEAVQGVEGFIVAQRDWGTVVNYIQMGPDMFPEVHTAGGSAVGNLLDYTASWSSLSTSSWGLYQCVHRSL